MSMENVKKFYELAETDKDFAQKLASLDSEMSLEASDLANLKNIVNEKIVPLAKEKGLEFTPEEMVDFANEKYMQLNKDDLLEVGGGVSPKTSGLALSSVLLLSLGSAAATNLMNNNHDDVSHVVSEPSKTASEEKDESEDEEALKKSLDEMMKKSPKGADKNANMEDIEKELDNLFKGGKLGGGSAFRPGESRTAGKNMLNRTIGKKGTSDFDFDKFLKELDDELAKEAPASQASKTKATISETSNFDFDKFMEEINSEKKSETAATRAATSDAAPIEETTKPAPISSGIPKKQSELNVTTADAIDDEFNFINYTDMSFINDLSSESEKNYEAVNQDDPWGKIMAHVMGALRKVNFDLGKLNAAEEIILKNDINWICGEMKASYGTYYLGASTLAGGYFRSKYGWNTTKPTLENKELEFLQALKASNYNKDDEKVQAALNALSVDEIKETTVKKPDASGTDQERIEREKKAEEERLQKEKEELKRQADKRAADFKEALINDFKESASTKVDDDALRLYAEKYLKMHDEKDMDYVGMNVVFYANGSDGITENSSFDVLDVLREANNALPEKNSQGTFKSQEAAQKLANSFADTFKTTVEQDFNNNYKTQLTEAELQQFVSEITGAVKSDETMQKAAIVEGNLVKFFAKGQLKDNTPVEASETVDLLVFAKELNSKLPKPAEEKKDETVKPQEELKETPVVKPVSGAVVTTAKELQQQAEAQKEEAKTKLTEKFNEKIKANNDIELNEANLNKLISETLNSYNGKENIPEKKENTTDITFTAKGVKKGGDNSPSATLNVRKFFTNLNDKAKTAHDTAMKQKIEEKKNAVKKEIAAKKLGVSLNKKLVPITEAELQQAHDFFVSELRKEISKEFEAKIRDIYSVQCKVARINFDSSKGVPTAVAAKIVNDLTEEQKKEIINSVMKNRLTTFQKPGEIKAHEQHGVLSWEPAALNEEVKVKVTANVKNFLGGDHPTAKEAIVNVRDEVNSLIENYKLSYETVISRKADTEVDKLFEFLEKKELIKDGKIVDNVLDAIKDSDKEQFKKDVKHIAGQINGSEDKYTLSGNWLSYNIAQEKLKAIKDLAGQLGV